MPFASKGFDYGSPHTQKFAYTGTSVIYIGKADPGTATTEAKWQIQFLTYNGSNLVTDIQWAAGNNRFEHVWDDRATLAFS